MNRNRFIVSYPRSGSTWLRYLLTSIVYPNEELTVDNVDRLAPDIHEMGKWNELGVKNPFIIKSHFRDNVDYENSYIIYLYRDFRDVAVSYYFFREEQEDFHDYLTNLVMNGMQFGKWENHIDYWLFGGENPYYFYSVSYEKLYNDTRFELKSIARFLGLDASIDVITEAIKRCKFGKMRRIAERDGLKERFLGYRGRPGRWKEMFTTEDLDYVWYKYKYFLKHLGYEEGNIKNE